MPAAGYAYAFMDLVITIVILAIAFIDFVIAIVISVITFIWSCNCLWQKQCRVSKAGGSNRKRSKQSSSQVTPVVAVLTTQPTQAAIANALTNGNGTTPLLQ